MCATEKVNGRVLKTLRMMKSFNQAEVAERMGICLSAYQSKENGHIEFKASELNKLSQIFGVALETFFRNETDMYETMRRE